MFTKKLTKSFLSLQRLFSGSTGGHLFGPGRILTNLTQENGFDAQTIGKVSSTIEKAGLNFDFISKETDPISGLEGI